MSVTDNAWLLFQTFQNLKMEILRSVPDGHAGLEVIEKLQATELPSASNVARHPKDFMKFTQKCPLYMHRPCSTFTIPLTAMFRAFGEFQEIFHEGLPTPEDCRLAMRLCEISSKVGCLAEPAMCVTVISARQKCCCFADSADQ